MNDIAIKYEKIDIGDGDFCFKPVKVIEGILIEDQECFLTVDNEIYYPLDDGVPTDSENYFDFFVSSEEIMETAMGVELTGEALAAFKNSFFNRISKQPIYGHATENGMSFTGHSKGNVIAVSDKIIKCKLCDQIIGQDRAIETVVDTVFRNFTLEDYHRKQHIILAGPKGSGKSEIVRELCKNLYVANYQASVAGERLGITTPQEIINNLIAANGGDMERASRGIILFDDLQDVLEVYPEDETYAKFFAQPIVQIMRRKPIVLDNNTVFDTSKLTVIIEIADKYIYSDDQINRLGFGSSDQFKHREEVFKQDADYVNAGITARTLENSRVVRTNELTRPVLKRLILESTISPLKVMSEKCKVRNIEFYASKSFVDLAAKEIYAMGKGAHGIREYLEEKLQYANDVLKGDVKRLRLTHNTATNPKQFEYSK